MNSRLWILLAVCVLFLNGCSAKTLTRSNLAFNTVATVTLYDGDEEDLEQAFKTIEHYDKIFDAHNPESEISKITTIDTPVSEETISLLETNIDYNKLTGGAVSPTLGRLIALWDIGEPTVKEAPDPESVKSSLQGSEVDNLVVNSKNHTVHVASESTKIDLGASTKGFVADKIKEQLKDSGVTSAIINLGGNVLTLGDNHNKPFKIGIDNPDRDSEEPIGILEVTDKSVVTSGNYQRYFTTPDGKVYHHILDPQTGYPVENGLDEVVVVSDSSLEGDLLSTALFVMGRERGIEFLKKHEGVSAIFVEDKEIWLSENLKSKFTLEPYYSDTYRLNYF